MGSVDVGIAAMENYYGPDGKRKVRAKTGPKKRKRIDVDDSSLLGPPKRRQKNNSIVVDSDDES